MTAIKRFSLRIFCCAVMIMAIQTVIHAQGSHWSVNPYDYQYDMTIYAQLKLNNAIVTDYSDLEIAAFVGNECRGVAEAQSIDRGDTEYHWLYMRVRSNQESGEVVSFKFYDKTTGTETVLRNTADFVSLAQIGTASSPYTLSIEYTITFETGEGSKVDAITQDYSSAITPPQNPERTGYSFNGWDPALPETMPAEDMTVTAKWTINKYTITFETGEGSKVDAITQDYSSAITPPQNPERTGYSFNGWDPALPETMPAEDMTVTAKWTINKYTITFETGEGSKVDAITQDYSSAITPPQNPERTGYSFNGWDPALPETMPAEDMTVTAKWTINKYTLTYKVDGEIYSESVLDYASAIIPLEEPSKEGHTFSGWNKVPKTMPEHDVIVEGTFSVNSYNVIYLVDSKEVHRERVEYGATLPEYSYTPQEEYLVFNGWIGEHYEKMPAHDVTYIADITNTSTAINLIFTNDKHLQIHTINGVNLNQHEGISTLPDGTYIINGKKVYIEN